MGKLNKAILSRDRDLANTCVSSRGKLGSFRAFNRVFTVTFNYIHTLMYNIPSKHIHCTFSVKNGSLTTNPAIIHLRVSNDALNI